MKFTALIRKLLPLLVVLALAFPAAASLARATGQTPPEPPVLQLAVIPIVGRVRRLQLDAEVQPLQTVWAAAGAPSDQIAARSHEVEGPRPPRDCLARGPPRTRSDIAPQTGGRLTELPLCARRPD
jgi:hypothetical protein